jgi:hypothetical protein
MSSSLSTDDLLVIGKALLTILPILLSLVF